MNSSITQSRLRPTFFETQVVNLFKKLPKGSLQLDLPDGRTLIFGNGDEVDAFIIVRELDFFRKCTLSGDIGFAESYMDGDWETPNMPEVIKWFIINLPHNPVLAGNSLKRLTGNLMRYVNNWYHKSRRNTIDGSKRNIVEHYDLGNDFYRLFLDKTMTYSSAIFASDDQPLEAAQFEKYDRICRQLDLKPDDNILEIGGGWGGFAVHAARHYGCTITTVTISDEQFRYAHRRFNDECLSHKITIHNRDYRNITGKFDKIVSIEMLEAVGHEYLPVFFKKCNELLKENGSLMLQVITSRDQRYAAFRKDVDFIQKYIFPGSQTPSLSAIQEAITKVSCMTLFDLKDMGMSYALTLRHWYHAFNLKLDEVKRLGMDDRFIRKWNYYLQYCEAAFQLKHISVVQLMYKK